jgi:hypothetical protein
LGEIIRPNPNVGQAELFEEMLEFPPGFQYRPEFISRAEERRLLDHFKGLSGGGLQKANDIRTFFTRCASRPKPSPS